MFTVAYLALFRLVVGMWDEVCAGFTYRGAQPPNPGHRLEDKLKEIQHTGTRQPVRTISKNHQSTHSLIIATDEQLLHPLQQNKPFTHPLLSAFCAALISSLFSQCKKNKT